MDQPITAEYMGGKLYKFFVRENIDPKLKKELGVIFRGMNYEVALSRDDISIKDFYSQGGVGTHIKSPVELAVSTYVKLGLTDAPGV